MKEYSYQNLALDIRAIFEKDHQMLNDLSFPFFFNFPKDSCQSASVFLVFASSNYFQMQL